MAFVSNKNDGEDNITFSQTLLANKDAHIAIWFSFIYGTLSLHRYCFCLKGHASNINEILVFKSSEAEKRTTSHEQ